MEATVIYRAIADFAVLRKQIQGLRKDIRELEAEEAAYNAKQKKSSTPAKVFADKQKVLVGESKATDKATKSVTEYATETYRATKARQQQTKVIKESTHSLEDETEALEDSTKTVADHVEETLKDTKAKKQRTKATQDQTVAEKDAAVAAKELAAQEKELARQIRESVRLQREQRAVAEELAKQQRQAARDVRSRERAAEEQAIASLRLQQEQARTSRMLQEEEIRRQRALVRELERVQRQRIRDADEAARQNRRIRGLAPITPDGNLRGGTRRIAGAGTGPPGAPPQAPDPDPGGRSSKRLQDIFKYAKKAGGAVAGLFGAFLKLALIGGLIGPGIAWLAAMTSAVLGVAGALVQLSGAILALPAVLAVAIVAISTLVVALKGVMKVWQAHTQMQESAAADAKAQADAEKAAAKQITNALKSLKRAREDAARSAEDAAERVADAQESIVDAQKAAVEAEEDAAERVADAQESLADSRKNAVEVAKAAAEQITNALKALKRAREDGARAAEDANERVSDADRTLEKAQKNVLKSQEDLNEARREALKDLIALREEVSRGALDEEQAIAALERAQEAYQNTLAEPGSSEADKLTALANLHQAEQDLADVQEKRSQDGVKLAEAEKKGIKGSERVLDAQENLKDSEEGLSDAKRNLKEAQEDQARSAVDSAERIQDAQKNLADAQEHQTESALDSAERIQDAQKNLADAQEHQTESALDSAERIQDAQESLIDAQEDQARSAVDSAERIQDAQENLAEAYEALEEAQSMVSAGASAYAKALANLSPNAQKFVLGLLAMKGAFKSIKMAVQDAFFKPLVGQLKGIRDALPEIEKNLVPVAAALGDVVAAWLEWITSPGMRPFFRMLTQSTARIVRILGPALIDIFEVLTVLIIAALPFVERFAKALARGAANMEHWAEKTSTVGQLAGIFEKAAQRGREFWAIIKNLVGAFGNLLTAADDFNDWIMGGLVQGTKNFKDFTAAQKQPGSPFKKYLEDIKPLLQETGALLKAFMGYIFGQAADPRNITAAIEILRQIRTELGPAMARLFDAIRDRKLIQKFIDAITALTDALAAFIEKGGGQAMEMALALFEGLGDAFKWLVDHTPAGVLATISGILGGLALMKFSGVLGLLAALAATGPVGAAIAAAVGIGALATAGAVGGGVFETKEDGSDFTHKKDKNRVPIDGPLKLDPKVGNKQGKAAGDAVIAAGGTLMDAIVAEAAAKIVEQTRVAEKNRPMVPRTRTDPMMGPITLGQTEYGAEAGNRARDKVLAGGKAKAAAAAKAASDEVLLEKGTTGVGRGHARPGEAKAAADKAYAASMEQTAKDAEVARVKAKKAAQDKVGVEEGIYAHGKVIKGGGTKKEAEAARQKAKNDEKLKVAEKNRPSVTSPLPPDQELNTTGDALQSLKDNWDELGESLSSAGKKFSWIGGFFKGAFTIAVQVVITILDDLVIAITWVVNEFNKMVARIKWVVGKIVDFFQWLYDKLFGHSIIPDLINGIVGLFKKLPGWLLDALKELPGKLFTAAKAIMRGLWNGLVWLWDNVLWPGIKAMPGKIWSLLGTLGTFLLEAGKKLLRGMWNGIKWLWDNVLWPGIKALPGKIWTALGSLGTFLWDAGKKLLKGLWNGIKWLWDNVLWPGIKAFPGLILDGLKKLPGLLVNTGKLLIEGLKSGIEIAWNALKKWLPTLLRTGFQAIFRPPVDFLVNTVVNKWILGPLRNIPWLGSKIPSVSSPFDQTGGDNSTGGRSQAGGRTMAKGDQVPGMGDRDTVPAMLTPGEFVIRKRSVKKLGLDKLRHMNVHGEVPQHFGLGGWVASKAKGIANQAKDIIGSTVGNVKDFAANVARKGAVAVLKPIFNTILAGPAKGNMVAGVPHDAFKWLTDKVLTWVAGKQKEHDAEAASSGVGGPMGPTGGGDMQGATDRGRRAVAWAQGQSNANNASWWRLCLRAVRTALGVGAKNSSAEQGWYDTEQRMGTASTPPAGTPVWWTGGTWGHVALSDGDGNAWSNDYRRRGMIDRHRISDISRDWGFSYKGWTRDINDVQVYRKGGLATPGDVKIDPMRRDGVSRDEIRKYPQNLGFVKGGPVPYASLFNAGGLANAAPRYQPPNAYAGLSTVPPSVQNHNGGKSMTFGDININNPTQEAASDSIPRTIRKVSYLGSTG